MRTTINRGAIAASVFFLFTACAGAAIKPASLFTDSCVLQQKVPLPVWGIADPGEPITVAIAGQTAITKANSGGAWSVRLKPLTAGGPFTMTVTGAAGDLVTLSDVLVGEVWLCSGQSNMEFPVKYEANAGKEKATATDPMIHFARVQNIGASTPQTMVGCKWQVATPVTIADFSAVAFHFAQALRKDFNVPVGVIGSYWGGTTAEAWSSRDALSESATLRYMVGRERDDVASYPDRVQAFYDSLAVETPKYNAAKAAYDAAKAKWDIDSAVAKASGAPVPLAPKPPAPLKPPVDPETQPDPMHLYNGMIAPLIPYGIKGAIWYQGESNSERAFEYKELLPAMIFDWRRSWGEGDFPFLIVQLASFRPIATKPTTSTWAELREAQRQTALRSPNVGLTVITDVGDSTYIHPGRKRTVGERLAVAARGVAYGEAVEYTGPVFASTKTEGAAIRVAFTHVDGLKAGTVRDISDTGAVVATPDKLVGFELAGADQVYHFADAKIDGASVVVTCPDVTTPVTVRYGWADYPVANLENSAGLWASPFSTDPGKWLTQPHQ